MAALIHRLTHKHSYLMLIPKVYNVCEYTVTAEGLEEQLGVDRLDWC